MNTLRLLGWLALAAVLTSALALLAWEVWGVPLSQVVLVIDGQRIVLAPHVAGREPELAVGAFFAIALAVLVLMLVFPLVVLLPLGLAALGVALGLAAAAIVLAAAITVVLGPLWLLGWGLWRLLRDDDPPATIGT